MAETEVRSERRHFEVALRCGADGTGAPPSGPQADQRGNVQPGTPGRFHSERQDLALMNHPNIARIAIVYRYMERWPEAEGLLREALEVNRRRLGPVHLLTVTSVSRLGALYLGWGRYEKAAELLEGGLDPMRWVGRRNRVPTISSGWSRRSLPSRHPTQSNFAWSIFEKTCATYIRDPRWRHASTKRTGGGHFGRFCSWWLGSPLLG